MSCSKLSSYLPICGCGSCIESCYEKAEEANKVIYRIVAGSLYCTALGAFGCAAFGFISLAGRVDPESALIGFGATLICFATFFGACCLSIHEESRVEMATNRTLERGANAVEQATEQAEKLQKVISKLDDKAELFTEQLTERNREFEGYRKEVNGTTETLIKILGEYGSDVQKLGGVSEELSKENQLLFNNLSTLKQVLEKFPTVPSQNSEGFEKASKNLDRFEETLGITKEKG